MGLEGGVIKDGGGHLADIGYLAAGGDETFHHGGHDAGARDAGIAADVDLGAGLAADGGADGAAEQDDVLAEQVAIGDAANVVLAEDGGLQHDS